MDQKKIICCLFLFLGLKQLSAQISESFRLGVDFGVVQASSSTDVVVGSDFRYFLSPRINIGFRLEGAAIARKIESSVKSKTKGQSRLNLAYLLVMDYYLPSNKKIAPFLSGGIGYYQLADISFDISPTWSPIELSSKVGLMLKAGIEIDKIRITAGGNLVPSSKISISTSNQQKFTNSYFTFSLGFYVGRNSRNSSEKK